MDEIPGLNAAKRINLKFVFFGIVIIVIIIALWMLLGSFSQKSINAYFNPTSALKAGDSTILVVELTNVYGKDLNDVVISVTAVDPTTVAVADSPQTEAIFGAGETRKFMFPLTIGQGREGTYSLDIEADFDVKVEKLRTALTIIK